MAGIFGSSSGGGAAANRAFKQQLNKVYGWYTGGFIVFILALAVLEQMGLPRNWTSCSPPSRCMPASAS